MLRAFLLSLCLAGFTSSHGAESFYDRELQQLTEQHDKALAAAAAPINRNYQTALEQLLVRTTRNKDLEASAKVVAALRAIGAPAALPTAPEPPAQTGALSKAQIEDLLTGKSWVHNGLFHYKFTKDGKMTLTEDRRRGRYQIDEKNGFVAFTWDTGVFPGEGIKLNPDGLAFTHNKGGTFLPAK